MPVTLLVHQDTSLC